jgi:hypothetical protein
MRLAYRRVTEGRRTRSSAAFRSGGTESSNPASSSGESGANSSQVDEVAERFRTFEELGYTDVLVRQQRSAEVSLERLRIRLRS